LAEMACQGDGQAYHLWMEYVSSTYGKRQITWSRGGKDLLGVTDKSDEDLASQHPGSDEDASAEEETPVVVMSIQRDIWHYVISQGLPGRLLEVARQGGKDAVRDYLDWIAHRMRGSP